MGRDLDGQVVIRLPICMKRGIYNANTLTIYNCTLQ